MELFANFNTNVDADPAAWARQREAEGYDGVVASDHFWIGENPYPHVFVTLTQIACGTETLRSASSFCNNLFRSPVEFAQASLALHKASAGRFEAGLGAGWSKPEIAGIGWKYPEARDRAGRYIEALQVVRQLFVTGRCNFIGDYYDVQVPAIGPYDGSAPLLVGSAGGPRTRREISPIVDRIEVFVGEFTRGGSINLEILSQVTDQQVQDLIGQVREIRSDLPIGYFTLFAAGEGPEFDALESLLGQGFAASLVGHPGKIKDSLRKMESWGLSRVQLTEMVPGSFSSLSGVL